MATQSRIPTSSTHGWVLAASLLVVALMPGSLNAQRTPSTDHIRSPTSERVPEAAPAEPDTTTIVGEASVAAGARGFTITRGDRGTVYAAAATLAVMYGISHTRDVVLCAGPSEYDNCRRDWTVSTTRSRPRLAESLLVAGALLGISWFDAWRHPSETPPTLLSWDVPLGDASRVNLGLVDLTNPVRPEGVGLASATISRRIGR